MGWLIRTTFRTEICWKLRLPAKKGLCSVRCAPKNSCQLRLRVPSKMHTFSTSSNKISCSSKQSQIIWFWAKTQPIRWTAGVVRADMSEAHQVPAQEKREPESAHPTNTTEHQQQVTSRWMSLRVGLCIASMTCLARRTTWRWSSGSDL